MSCSIDKLCYQALMGTRHMVSSKQHSLCIEAGAVAATEQSAAIANPGRRTEGGCCAELALNAEAKAVCSEIDVKSTLPQHLLLHPQ